MEKFFYPESIAVFGVSETPSNLARVIVENLVSFGFQGNVYPVGMTQGQIAGMKILPGLDGIDGIPDLAVVLVPARYAPETLERCGKKGIRNVVLESGGFSEFSGDRRSLEAEVLSITRRYGMRIVGPNCFGIVNLEAGVILPFFIIDPEYMKKGSASLISQSGGIFYDTCMLCSVENVGLRKLVSIGNKLMTSENDILEYLLQDRETGVVGLYLESFSDGRRFMGLAATTDKPIVVLKANRSPSSGEIARFHTTALAGDDEVADAAMKQAGVIRVTNFQEMVDCFKIFNLPILKGRRLVLISRSGGHGVLSADAARRYGFEFARLSEKFLEGITRKKLNVIAATNPLDIGDVYDLNEYAPILDMALQEEEADGVVFVITYSSESDGGKVRDFVRYVSQVTPLYDKPVALCVVTNRSEWFGIKEAADFPVFTDVDQAVRALEWSLRHHEAKAYGRRAIPRLHQPSGPATGKSPSCRFLDPEECFSFLSRWGLPVADNAAVQNRDEAIARAEGMGYPVALKAGQGGILHKSEAKGVFLDIGDREALARAFDAMDAKRCLVQKMAPRGREIIIGGRQDNEFGPVVVCGLGGIYVEILADRSIRVAPVDEETAGAMIDELKGSAILRGARGRRPADIKALKDVIVRVSNFLMDNPDVVNLDINPVIVYDEGKGCVIVDAKVEVAKPWAV
ncbi:MAG: acetate--CoA ligase family protein [Syntrophorhabdaceae bacterium]|nr:acetate--CoA ligase family protein [Syntrophorhabdaceae bacterium]